MRSVVDRNVVMRCMTIVTVTQVCAFVGFNCPCVCFIAANQAKGRKKEAYIPNSSPTAY